MECDYGTSFEAENPQTWSEVVAPNPAVGKRPKVSATLLDSIDVPDCAFRAVAPSDVVVQIDQIAEGLRAEFNLVAHAVSSTDPHAAREW